MSERRVSVVIPVHDGERYLAAAIESVLEQTLPPAEVIVVDDGSTDSSVQVAERYAPQGVRCHSQANAGGGAARNRGVALSEGDFIAFLDADDLWELGKLEQKPPKTYIKVRCEDAVFGLAMDRVVAIVPLPNGVSGTHRKVCRHIAYRTPRRCL